MARACRKVLSFERGGYGAKGADNVLAGMRGFWSWTAARKERYALLLYSVLEVTMSGTGRS